MINSSDEEEVVIFHINQCKGDIEGLRDNIEIIVLSCSKIQLKNNSCLVILAVGSLECK